MSVQVRRRREAAPFLASFVGAQGELIVDTTNNRIQVHDGTTPGGFSAAKLAEVVTNARTAVTDASYTVLVTDRTIAITALTAARTLSLPAAAAYPTGSTLTIVDETGACSATNTLTIARAGTDTINGASIYTIASAYGYVALESNGSGKWTVIDAPGLASPVAIANGGTGATNAQAALVALGAIGRTTVSDANYTALTSDRMIVFSALTAARTVALPASATYPTGTSLTIVDEVGTCSPAVPINVAVAGADLVNGTTGASLTTAFGYLALESNGAGRWTIVDQSPFSGLTTLGQSASFANIQVGVSELLVTLSGSSVTTSLLIPARAIVLAVSSRTVVAVSGAPSYGVGVSGNATQFGGSLGTAAGSTNVGVIGPSAFYAATPLVITPTSGSFIGGQVRLALHYLLCGAPTT